MADFDTDDNFILIPAVSGGGALVRRSQIADRLAISGTTVAFHLRNIFSKTGVQRQAELVALILSVPLAQPVT